MNNRTASRCDAEMCPYWTGQGCICEVFDLHYPARLPIEEEEEEEEDD